MLPSASHFCFKEKALDVSPLNSGHFALYAQLYRDEKLMTYIGRSLTAEQAHASFVCALKLNAACPTKRVFLVIYDRNTCNYAGLLGVSTVTSQQNCIEVGIMLLMQFHRSGLAGQALAALCKTVFLLLPDVTIVGRIDPGNRAAKKLVAKLGFVYCNETGCYNLLAGTFQFQKSTEGVK